MKLTVSLAQISVAAAKPQENLEKARGLIARASQQGSEVICFPEMWTTGLNWRENARIAKEHEAVIEQVGGFARRYNIWINGSMLCLNEQGKPANANILFDNKGREAGVYYKAHLFRPLHEDQYLSPGNKLVIVDTPWGTAGLSVCYDLRFPELFRAYALKGVKIIFSPSAFPHPKIEHWKVLMRARAIENQIYMIGINQAGSEDLGPDGISSYFGDSIIVDPWGQVVAEAGREREELLTACLDMDMVDEVRARMPVLQDRRPELYGI